MRNNSFDANGGLVGIFFVLGFFMAALLLFLPFILSQLPF
jgi:hypothetical protein